MGAHSSGETARRISGVTPRHYVTDQWYSPSPEEVISQEAYKSVADYNRERRRPKPYQDTPIKPAPAAVVDLYERLYNLSTQVFKAEVDLDRRAMNYVEASHPDVVAHFGPPQF